MLNSLEFRNEEEHAKLKPSKSKPKEVPFMKNNPREKELDPADQHGETTTAEVPKTER